MTSTTPGLVARSVPTIAPTPAPAPRPPAFIAADPTPGDTVTGVGTIEACTWLDDDDLLIRTSAGIAGHHVAIAAADLTQTGAGVYAYVGPLAIGVAA